MKILLHHQRSINGTHYAKGTHELPDAMQTHWYIQALVKDGDAVIVEHAKKSKVASSQESEESEQSDSSDLDLGDLDDSDLDLSDDAGSEDKASPKKSKTSRNHKGR